MLVVDYQSKSYQRFLADMAQIAKHKTRFLITLNGASDNDLSIVSEQLSSITESTIQCSYAISDKVTENSVMTLFSDERSSRNILLFKNSDLLFDKKTALKSSHERDCGFDLNNFFKCIAKHNGIILLATKKKQTLNASMSTKVDVLIRFPAK